jgi:hypothetical protein
MVADAILDCIAVREFSQAPPTNSEVTLPSALLQSLKLIH